jgi:hypothetical protein
MKRVEPVPDSTLQGTILACSSKTDQATCFSSALSSIIDSMGRSKNYFNHKAALPHLKKLTLAYMATGKWHDSKLTRIDNKNMMGFALPMLLPDTSARIKAKGNLLHIFDAEDALEEVSEKCTKLSTAFTPVTSMNAINDVLVALANLKGFFAVWFSYNLDDSTLSAPALVMYADEMADKMTSKEANRSGSATNAAPPLRPSSPTTSSAPCRCASPYTSSSRLASLTRPTLCKLTGVVSPPPSST